MNFNFMVNPGEPLQPNGGEIKDQLKGAGQPPEPLCDEATLTTRQPVLDTAEAPTALSKDAKPNPGPAEQDDSWNVLEYTAWKIEKCLFLSHGNPIPVLQT